MINVNRLSFIKEKVDYLARQVELAINWVPSAKLEAVGPEAAEEKSKITQFLSEEKNAVLGIYEEVSRFDKRQILEKTPLNIQMDVIDKVDGILKKLTEEIEKLATKHPSARLDPFAREIKKGADDLFEEFDLILPNIKYEIEKIQKYFSLPINAEKSILEELNKLVFAVQRRNISLKQFFNGYNKKGEWHRGFNELRTVEEVFSPYQYYENTLVQYDSANASAYAICKALESFIQEKRGEPEYLQLSEKFDEINRRGMGKRRRQKVELMADLFEINSVFKHLIKKMGIKYSFKDEYKRALKEYENFQNILGKLIVYNTDYFEEKAKSLLDRTSDKEIKDKLSAIFRQMREAMNKKIIPFSKLDSLFKQLATGDMNVVVEEKEADDLTIQMNPEIVEKYGEKILRKINILVDEIDFWYFGIDRLSKYERIGEFTTIIQDCGQVNMESLEAVLSDLDAELENRFRIRYDARIINLIQVGSALEKTFSNKIEHEKLNKQLMEKDGIAVYMPLLQKAKKSLLVASSLIKGKEKEGTPLPNINKFPFIKLSCTELCFILYELTMRIFTLFPNIDRRSTNNMINILSVYREFHEALPLWQAFSLIRKTSSAANLDILESKVKLLSKNPVVIEEINAIFSS